MEHLVHQVHRVQEVSPVLRDNLEDLALMEPLASRVLMVHWEALECRDLQVLRVQLE